MLKYWVRWLPYWIIIWIVRHRIFSDGQGTLKVGTEYKIKYFQMSEGEFVVFSQELQDKFDERKRAKKGKALDKKLDKLNKQLNRDYSLKSKLKKQFKDEDEEGVY